MRDLDVGLHAVRGSLAVIRGQCFSVRRSGASDAVTEGARLIDAEVDRILEEIERISGRTADAAPAATRVRAIAGEVVIRHLAAAEQRGIALRLVDGSSDPVLRGDGDRLRLALDNLVQNAIRHCRPDGEIVISLGTTRHGSRLTVRNDGDSPPAGELRRVFGAGERGARPSGIGWGLGLAIASREVAACGGSIAARPLDGGCAFEIDLPVGVA